MGNDMFRGCIRPRLAVVYFSMSQTDTFVFIHFLFL